MFARHSVIPRTMCFVFFEGKVLLIKASTEKEWQGFYNPLGGHIEKGENIIDSATREIKEESGLDVSDTTLKGIVHVEDFYSKNVMMFVTTSNADTNNVQSNHEGELEWVDTKSIAEVKLFADVQPIMEHITTMDSDKIFTGTSKFDGKDKLLSFDVQTN